MKSGGDLQRLCFCVLRSSSKFFAAVLEKDIILAPVSSFWEIYWWFNCTQVTHWTKWTDLFY